MALMPHGRLGPPLWSFAADAHDCIMVLVRLDRPHTSSWRDAAPVGGLPLRSLWLTPPGASCRGDQIEPDEDKKPEKKRLTEKAPYKFADRVPNHSRVLAVRCCTLVIPIPSRRPLRHAVLPLAPRPRGPGAFTRPAPEPDKRPP